MSKVSRRSRRRSVRVEPFSMSPRVSVGSVDTRYEDGEEVPAINVKPPPLYRRMPVKLQAASDDLRSTMFDMVAQEWWDVVAPGLVDQHLAPAFRGMNPHAQAAGRSSGWLTVRGVGSPTEWSGRQLRAWGKFEKAVKKSMLDAEKEWHRQIREQM